MHNKAIQDNSLVIEDAGDKCMLSNFHSYISRSFMTKRIGRKKTKTKPTKFRLQTVYTTRLNQFIKSTDYRNP